MLPIRQIWNSSEDEDPKKQVQEKIMGIYHDPSTQLQTLLGH